MTPGPFGVGAVFFDLFGTLLPLGPLDAACDRLAPGRGPEIAARWRARQIEATWLRTIMDRWADFDVVTHEALLATLTDLQVDVSGLDGETLADVGGAFGRLPLEPAAPEVLRDLRAGGLDVGILTNASQRTLDAVVARLGLPFGHALSVDAVRRFKPDPAVYDLAVRATGLQPSRIGFVTGNGWDAAGAATFGLRVAWLGQAGTGSLPAVGAPPPMRLTWPDVRRTFEPDSLR